MGRRDGECGSVGGYVCVCGRVGGCAGIQANTEGVGVRRRAAGWKPRETDGSVQQLLGSLAGGWWKGKESDLEVRLAISPGVVLESAAGVAASVRSGSYRVVTVPTVRHAAHLPLWADRAVLLGHFQSCPATNSPSCGTGLTGSACAAVFGFQSGQSSILLTRHAVLDGTVSLGNLWGIAQDIATVPWEICTGCDGAQKMTSSGYLWDGPWTVLGLGQGGKLNCHHFTTDGREQHVWSPCSLAWTGWMTGCL